MDTSTHIAMGFGLAGLSSLDPAVAADPVLAHAILAGTLLGSNAPDFDYAVKLFKGEGAYLRHHRARSHSVPAWIIWSVLLTACIWPFFSGIDLSRLFGWTFAAVLIHVFVDLFNSYGTQAGRPFSKKWITFDAIYIFDPFIMLLHIIGFALWGGGLPSGQVFAAVYTVMILYMLQRLFASRKVKGKAEAQIASEFKKVKAIPTIRFGIWHVCAESETAFMTGEYRHGQFTWIHTFKKTSLSSPVIQAALSDPNVQHFHVNAEMAHAILWRKTDGYEVRWFDVRYRTKQHYPFMAIVHVDFDLRIAQSKTGWLHHIQTLEQPEALTESVSH
ncbi:metal-dependent hydrolase [Bacillus sp. FJAT-42376]|uniref:metal-dependent hydrolase n=1 Tax=Bacillus sp. FJAT-42376 TaxID=2014076 RepID=UPI000F4DF228|nr:metal-dependent hydrolase [Bacillus sp. FJAT-42376]AZB43265.1 metal-dependent hydrolase [Bacillus sp. FJAT-42376]